MIDVYEPKTCPYDGAWYDAHDAGERADAFKRVRGDLARVYLLRRDAEHDGNGIGDASAMWEWQRGRLYREDWHEAEGRGLWLWAVRRLWTAWVWELDHEPYPSVRDEYAWGHLKHDRYWRDELYEGVGNGVARYVRDLLFKPDCPVEPKAYPKGYVEEACSFVSHDDYDIRGFAITDCPIPEVWQFEHPDGRRFDLLDDGVDERGVQHFCFGYLEKTGPKRYAQRKAETIYDALVGGGWIEDDPFHGEDIEFGLD